jgi:hypothetical protein
VVDDFAKSAMLNNVHLRQTRRIPDKISLHFFAEE